MKKLLLVTLLSLSTTVFADDSIVIEDKINKLDRSVTTGRPTANINFQCVEKQHLFVNEEHTFQDVIWVHVRNDYKKHACYDIEYKAKINHHDMKYNHQICINDYSTGSSNIKIVHRTKYPQKGTYYNHYEVKVTSQDVKDFNAFASKDTEVNVE